MTLMGRPGPTRGRRRATRPKSKRYRLPRPPSFNEPDLTRQAVQPDARRAPADDRGSRSQQLQLDYEGRIGSLLAVDDHVKRLVDTLRKTGQLQEHADRVPLRQRLAPGPAPHPGRQVPALRGVAAHPADPARPGRAGGPDGARAGRQHRLRARRCSTRPARKAGRTHGRRVAAAHGPQPAQAAEARSSQIEAPAPLFRGDIPVNAWDRPYKGVRTDRYTYVVYTRDRRAGAVRPAQGPAPAAQRRRRARPTRTIKAKLAREARASSTAARAARAASSREARRPAGRGRARAAPPAPGAAPRTLAGLHDARYCEIIELKGALPDGHRRRSGTRSG